MRVDCTKGLIEGASFIASPNCNERPCDAVPELVVIHGISLPAGEFGGPAIIDLFTNQLDTLDDPRFGYLDGLRVSAHLLIRRDGALIQFVPFTHRAWHAGQSVFAGRCECNDFSIGIELEGTDDRAYTEHQYQVLEAVIQALRDAYPAIGTDRVVGHCHIAPQRKTDPGDSFDWARLVRQLNIAMPATQQRMVS